MRHIVSRTSQVCSSTYVISDIFASYWLDCCNGIYAGLMASGFQTSVFKLGEKSCEISLRAVHITFDISYILLFIS